MYIRRVFNELRPWEDTPPAPGSRRSAPRTPSTRGEEIHSPIFISISITSKTKGAPHMKTVAESQSWSHCFCGRARPEARQAPVPWRLLGDAQGCERGERQALWLAALFLKKQQRHGGSCLLQPEHQGGGIKLEGDASPVRTAGALLAASAVNLHHFPQKRRTRFPWCRNERDLAWSTSEEEEGALTSPPASELLGIR